MKLMGFLPNHAPPPAPADAETPAAIPAFVEKALLLQLLSAQLTFDSIHLFRRSFRRSSIITHIATQRARSIPGAIVT